MGGSVSTGRDNDELVDNLVEADYIQSAIVERVFRAVDRADYYLAESRDGAYRDVAWKCGNLHLSAPCVYSKVMEGLNLQPGQSFLNLGSGTGYLNTMAGLILGTYGINHGIEIHKDVIKYAYEKLAEFKKYSPALDENDFAEPKFIHGNALCFAPEMRLYDRVYCGARCPESAVDYMKRLIKIGGILIMPVNGLLLQVTRTGKSKWEVESLLSVSFAPLIMPTSDEALKTIKNIECQPIELQEACRAVIRSILRRNIELENPDIKTKLRKQAKRPRKRPLVGDIFNIVNDGIIVDRHSRRRKDTQVCLKRIYNLVEVFKDDALETLESTDAGTTNDNNNSSSSSSPENESEKSQENKTSSSNNTNNNNNNSIHSSDNESEKSVHEDESMETTSDSDWNSSSSSPSNSNDSCNHTRKYKLRNKPKVEVICDSDSDGENINSDSDTENTNASVPKTPYISPYTVHMRSKIQALPLPPILKCYVNYGRSFD